MQYPFNQAPRKRLEIHEGAPEGPVIEVVEDVATGEVDVTVYLEEGEEIVDENIYADENGNEISEAEAAERLSEPDIDVFFTEEEAEGDGIVKEGVEMPDDEEVHTTLIGVEEAGPEDLAAAEIESVTVDEGLTTVEYTDGDELTAPEGTLSVEDVKPEEVKPAEEAPKKAPRKSSGSRKNK